MNMLKKILDNIETYIIWICFIPLIILMFWQVVARYCFGLAWGWLEQVSRLLYVYIGFAGMSLVSIRREHIKVSFAAEFMPNKKIQKLMLLFGDIVMALVCAALFYLLTKMTILCAQQKQVFAGAPFIGVWVMYFAGVLGMLGVTIRTFQYSIIPSVKELLSGEYDKPSASEKGEGADS